MNIAQRQATYQDLFDLPENVVGEIIAGQLHTHPRPAPAHARAPVRRQPMWPWARQSP